MTAQDIEKNRRIRQMREFWVTYVGGFFGLSYCFSLALISSEGFFIVTFYAFVLTTSGILCGQMLPNPWLWVTSAFALAAATLVGLRAFFTLNAWMLLVPLIIPSICIGTISARSRFVLFWGFMGALLPSIGLLGLVILENRMRLHR